MSKRCGHGTTQNGCPECQAAFYRAATPVSRDTTRPENGPLLLCRVAGCENEVTTDGVDACDRCLRIEQEARLRPAPRAEAVQETSYGCGLCEWERRPLGAKNAELVRVKQCGYCRGGSIREDIASVPGVGYASVDLLISAARAEERASHAALERAVREFQLANREFDAAMGDENDRDGVRGATASYRREEAVSALLKFPLPGEPR